MSPEEGARQRRSLYVSAAAFVGMFNVNGRDRGAIPIIEQAIFPATTTDAERTLLEQRKPSPSGLSDRVARDAPRSVPGARGGHGLYGSGPLLEARLDLDLHELPRVVVRALLVHRTPHLAL
jgi:hypothetical protein